MNITLYSLTDYNNGRLIPFTIDLDNIDDNEEYLTKIHNNLKRITKARKDSVWREECIV